MPSSRIHTPQELKDDRAKDNKGNRMQNKGVVGCGRWEKKKTGRKGKLGVEKGKKKDIFVNKLKKGGRNIYR